jgi:hypothetical protein
VQYEAGMLLVLTTSDDATADYLCRRLLDERVELVRLDTDLFAENSFIEYRDHEASLVVGGVRVHANAIRNVWYRRPRGIVIRGEGTEAQRLHTSREWGASLDGFLAEIPQPHWVNHPASNARAGNKLFQLSTAPHCGLRLPKTLITRSLEEAQNFWISHEGKVVAKPLSIGHVEALDGSIEAQILTSEVRAEHFGDPALLARCPTLLQQRVEKGVDIRVTVIDRQICALAASPQPGTPTPLDIRQDGMSDLVYEPVTLPAEIAAILLSLCEYLQLRFAAIDLIRSRDDEWFFLEVNPNGQWAWLDLVGASDIARLFTTTFGAER